MKKTILLFTLFLFLFLSLANLVLPGKALGQEEEFPTLIEGQSEEEREQSQKTSEQRALEIQYPDIPGAVTPEAVGTNITDYVKYVFNFSIWITGLVALGALVYGGFRYLTSTGKPEAIQDAKNQISAAFLGILIVLSSWFILTTINPELKIIQLRTLPTVSTQLQHGIYLCKKKDDAIKSAWNLNQEIQGMDLNDPEREKKIKQMQEYMKDVNRNCVRVVGQGNVHKNINNLAEYVYVLPSKAFLYGAILYPKKNFNGKAQIVLGRETDKASGFEIDVKPSSAKPFILNFQPEAGSYAETYKLTDFNRDDPDEESQTCELGENKKYATCEISMKRIGSVKIEGELFVIFYKEKQSGDWPSDKPAEIDVITRSDPTLEDNPMGKWCDATVKGWVKGKNNLGDALLFKSYPCAEQMVIVSGTIY